MRTACRVVASSIVVLLAPSVAWSLTFDEILIDKDEVGGVCEFVEGEHPVSVQAGVQFQMAGKDEAGISLYGNPKQKQFQSLECGTSKATVYYYEFPGKGDLDKRLAGIKRALWGEQGPTPMHPEQVMTLDSFLIVVSSREPDFFVTLLSHRSRFPNIENSVLDERLTRMRCDAKKEEKPEALCQALRDFKIGTTPNELVGRESLLVGQAWEVGQSGRPEAPLFEALYVGRLDDGTSVASFTPIEPENDDERKQIQSQMEAQRSGKRAENVEGLMAFLRDALGQTRARARMAGGRSLAFLGSGNRIYLRRQGPRLILTTNLMHPAKDAPFVVATFETKTEVASPSK